VAALAKEDDAGAREEARALIDTILLVSEDGRLRVEIRGELASILALVPPTKMKLCALAMKPAVANCWSCACGRGVLAQSMPVRSRCTGKRAAFSW
jgi:hypothetical protein